MNESTEAFIYSIIGGLETQQEFCDLVEDSVINYMNRTITNTNVILNLATSPSLWLMSSNLIKIKNPIKGYNYEWQHLI